MPPLRCSWGHRHLGDSASAAAARAFLAQERIAVVGASTDRRTFGNAVYRALRDHGYDVVPVDVAATEVEGERAYADLACALSAEALEACERAGVEVVAGACPLMFLEPVGSFHQAHRVAPGSLGDAA